MTHKTLRQMLEAELITSAQEKAAVDWAGMTLSDDRAAGITDNEVYALTQSVTARGLDISRLEDFKSGADKIIKLKGLFL